MAEKDVFVIDLVQDYLESLEIEGGRSRKTVDNYGLYLERLTEFGGFELKPADITDEWLRKYRLWLNRYGEISGTGKGLSVMTQAYHLIALRGFLKHLAKLKIPSLEPALVELPRVHRAQVTFLHVDEVERILAEIPSDTQTGLRDRAIMELLVHFLQMLIRHMRINLRSRDV